MSEETKAALPEEMEAFVGYIEQLSVMDLSKLVKALEDRLGVSAAAPVAVAGPAVAAEAEAEEEEEKTEFDVILSSYGEKKIGVIKVVRAVTGLGLKDAKALVEEAPKPVKEAAPKEEAEEIKAKLEEAGATVELK